jgi:hypothetical protein
VKIGLVVFVDSELKIGRDDARADSAVVASELDGGWTIEGQWSY